MREDFSPDDIESIVECRDSAAIASFRLALSLSNAFFAATRTRLYFALLAERSEAHGMVSSLCCVERAK